MERPNHSGRSGGFGDQFTYATHVPEPDDTADDRPLSADSGTDFGARFGDPFTYVMNAPAPDDTEVGNRSHSVIPDLSVDHSGGTDSSES